MTKQDKLEGRRERRGNGFVERRLNYVFAEGKNQELIAEKNRGGSNLELTRRQIKQEKGGSNRTKHGGVKESRGKKR